mmetsp:Transcript_43879/g.113331  ORF Transcript_43879/g.113331 Transcript_43879/m.113331 type:complete len:985 (+) Transcript_43879:49-3003(+)
MAGNWEPFVLRAIVRESIDEHVANLLAAMSKEHAALTIRLERLVGTIRDDNLRVASDASASTRKHRSTSALEQARTEPPHRSLHEFDPAILARDNTLWHSEVDQEGSWCGPHCGSRRSETDESTITMVPPEINIEKGAVLQRPVVAELPQLQDLLARPVKLPQLIVSKANSEIYAPEPPPTQKATAAADGGEAEGGEAAAPVAAEAAAESKQAAAPGAADASAESKQGAAPPLVAAVAAAETKQAAAGRAPAAAPAASTAVGNAASANAATGDGAAPAMVLAMCPHAAPAASLAAKPPAAALPMHPPEPPGRTPLGTPAAAANLAPAATASTAHAGGGQCRSDCSKSDANKLALLLPGSLGASGGHSSQSHGMPGGNATPILGMSRHDGHADFQKAEVLSDSASDGRNSYLKRRVRSCTQTSGGERLNERRVEGNPSFLAPRVSNRKKGMDTRILTIASLDSLAAHCTDQLFESRGLATVRGDDIGEAVRTRKLLVPGFPSMSPHLASCHSSSDDGSQFFGDFSREVPNTIGRREREDSDDGLVAETSAKSRLSASGSGDNEIPALLIEGLQDDKEEPDMLSSNSGAAARRSPLTSGMDALRAEHEHMLLEQKIEYEFMRDLPTRIQAKLPRAFLKVPRLALCIFGILPFRQGRYPSMGKTNCMLVILVSLAIVVWEIMHAVYAPELERYVNLRLACLAFGGLIGCLHLRHRGIEEILGPAKKPLEVYASHAGFLDDWKVKSMQRFMTAIFAWIAMLVFRKISSDHGCVSSTAYSMIVYCFVMGLLTMLTYSQLHICVGLELIIDSFCLRVYASSDLDWSIKEWNVIQAMLRRAAHTIDTCFLSLNTALFGTLMLTGLEVVQQRSEARVDGLASPAGGSEICTKLWVGAEIPAIALALYAVFRAAAVTEKCSRVPAMINSWTFEDEGSGSMMDLSRQYVVQYIIHSAAGFYVMGVRLTAFQALKLSYFVVLVLVTLGTQSLPAA